VAYGQEKFNSLLQKALQIVRSPESFQAAKFSAPDWSSG
jgi:hypothetical protein